MHAAITAFNHMCMRHSPAHLISKNGSCVLAMLKILIFVSQSRSGSELTLCVMSSTYLSRNCHYLSVCTPVTKLCCFVTEADWCEQVA